VVLSVILAQYDAFKDSSIFEILTSITAFNDCSIHMPVIEIGV